MKYITENKLLLAVLIIAFILRFWGIWWGLPFLLHLDEGAVISPAIKMIATGDLNPHNFGYPSLYRYLIYLLILFCKIFLKVDLTKDIVKLYFVCRFITAILSTYTVYLVYRIGKEFFSKRIGLLSSLVLSVLFLCVYLSHFTIVDVPALVFLLLAVLYASRIILKRDVKSYILAGLFAGLSFGTKYNFLAIFPVFIVHFLPPKPNKPKLIYLIYSLLAAGLGFLLTNPFFILDFKNYIPGIISQLLLVKGWKIIPMSDINGVSSWWWYLQYWFYSGVGPPLFISALLGAVLIAKDKKEIKRTICFFSFPVLYCFILFISHCRGDRYSLPLMPFFAILSGFFLSYILDIFNKLIKSLKLRFTLISITLVIFIGTATYKVGLLDFLISQKDTRVQASEWIAQNIPTLQLIFFDGGSSSAVGYLQGKGFSNIMQGIPFADMDIFKYPGELVLISSWSYREAKNYQMVGDYGEMYKIYNLIKNKGRLIKEFSKPFFKGEFFASANMESSSTVNLFHNPIIEIYEIPELSEYQRKKFNFEYLPQKMATSKMSLISKEGQTVLYADGKEYSSIVGPYILFPKGNYNLTYFIKNPTCIFGSPTLYLRVASAGGEKEFARKVFLCSDIETKTELALSFKLERASRLELILQSEEGASFLVIKALVEEK